MKTLRKTRSIVVRESEMPVRVSSKPVVPSSESHSQGIQAPHIREYDDHLTLVNKGVFAPRMVKSSVPIPKKIVSPIKLPEKGLGIQKPLITKGHDVLWKEYEKYVNETAVKKVPIGIWAINRGSGLTSSHMHHVICPACGKETGLIYGSYKPGEDFDLITSTVCFDCWKKYLRNGIMIIPNADPFRIKPSGKMAIVPEREFYVFGAKVVGLHYESTARVTDELPELRPDRVEIMNEGLFMDLGLNGPGIPASWGDKYVYKDWTGISEPFARKLRERVMNDEVSLVATGWFEEKAAAEKGLRQFVIFKEAGSNKFVVGVTNMIDLFIKQLGREFPTLREAQDYVKDLGGKV